MAASPGLLGFDLHARTSVAAGDREGLAGLCRYVLRPRWPKTA